MAGLKVVPVKVLATGELDMEDLRAKAEKHKDNLAAFMVTYPSTFGVFEDGVQEACEIIHSHGGQVYLDGELSSRTFRLRSFSSSFLEADSALFGFQVPT